MTTRSVFPARVNELICASPRQCFTLNGTWNFITDERRSLTPGQAARAQTATKLKVPGCWAAQGIGGAGLLKPTPYATNWFKGTYRGLGWYRKCFDCRPLMTDGRVWLKVGVVHGTAAIYLNGRHVGQLSRTIGAYRFDVTDLIKPAGNTLLIASDNDLSPCGAGDAMGVMGGLTQCVEIEQTAKTWIAAVHVRGAVKDKAAVGRISIRDADCGDRSAKYKIRLAARPTAGGAGQYILDIPFKPVARDDDSSVSFSLPIPDFQLWSPESPALYNLKIQIIKGNKVIDAYATRFGFRSLSVRGKKIILNGQPFFMAGCGTMTHNPQTVCPTTDRAVLRRVFRRMKAYGFVYVRYHTETPYAELFDAADEAGMLVQVENRPYNGESNEPVKAGGEIEFNAEMLRETEAETTWHIRETTMINEHLGNHPSLAVYCMGNEYYDNKLKTRKRWHAAVKRMDPTRLAISADGNYHHHPAADDYVAGYNNDISALRSAPVILHEFMSLPTLPDVREVKRFDGGMLVPESLRRYSAWARRNKIELARLRKISVASHKLQEAHLKYGIEKARAIPGIQGYGIWRYHDFWDFPTKMGIVTVHGADKDRVPADMSVYNNQSVLIANLARNNMEINCMPMGRNLEVYGSDQVEDVCRCGRSIALKIFISHFGACIVKGGNLQWKVSSGNAVLARGSRRVSECPPAAITCCGLVKWKMPDKGVPYAVRVEAVFESSSVKIANHWSLWAFPEKSSAHGTDLAVCGSAGDYFPVDVKTRRINDAGELMGREKETIVITDSLYRPGIKAILRNGGKVLLTSAQDFPSQAIVAHPGWWSAGPHRFTGAVLEKHPIFHNWPGTEFADWPFFRFFMSKEDCEFPEQLNGNVIPTTVVPTFHGKPFPHDAVAYGVRCVHEVHTCPTPHLQFNWMPYVFETRVGAGRVFACMLRLRNDPLAGNWLARTIIEYMRSDAFSPKARTTWNQLDRCRISNIADNCLVYSRRESKKGPIFMHGARKGTGFSLAGVMAPHVNMQPLSLQRFSPPVSGHYNGAVFVEDCRQKSVAAQYPKTMFVDLYSPRRIGRIQIENVAKGNVKNVRVSVGADQNSWKVLGIQRFPMDKLATLSFECDGPAARFVRVECLDSYGGGRGNTPEKLLLGKITVLRAK